MKINSAYRCPKHNAKVGGAKNSQHLESTAADLVAANVTPYELQEVILGLMEHGRIPNGGLGRYNTTHYDIRMTALGSKEQVMAKLRSDSEEEYAARKARVRAAAKKARKQADRENIKRTAKDVGKELAVDAAVGLATAGTGTIARAVGKGARMAAKGIRGARATKGRAMQKIARMPGCKLNSAAGKVSVKAVKAQKKKTGQTLSEAGGSVQRNKLMDKAKAKVKAGNLRQDKIEKAGRSSG